MIHISLEIICIITMKHMSYLGNYDLRYPNVFHDTYPNDKVLYIVKNKRHVQVLIKYRDGKRLHISQIAISQKENNNKYLFDVFAIHLDFADSKQLWKFADDFVSMILRFYSRKMYTQATNAISVTTDTSKVGC